MRGLERGHGQVVLRREVEALVAHPSQVERLALDGARGHVHELAQKADLLGVGKRGVVQHGAGDQRERQIAAVDGNALAVCEVHAGLAAPQLAVVGDVVVDERRALEVLDGRSGADGVIKLAAHGERGEHADERAMPLAGVLGKVGERLVEVSVDVGVVGLVLECGNQRAVDLVYVAVEKTGKRALHGRGSSHRVDYARAERKRARRRTGPGHRRRRARR